MHRSKNDAIAYAIAYAIAPTFARRLRYFLSSLALLVLLSACVSGAAPGTTTPEAPSPTATPGSKGPPTGAAPAAPAAIQTVREQLAEMLDVPVDQVLISSYEQVEWPDSCLGAAQEGEMCAQVITPGYKVIFATPQGEVEVHTNETGSAFRLAQPLPPEEFLAVEWERSGGIAGICRQLVIDIQGNYLIRDCDPGATPVTGRVPEDRMQQLNEYLDRFAQFEWQSSAPPGSADMFEDRYTFYGRGSSTPAPEQQEEINEFLATLEGELSRSANSGGSSVEAVPSGIEAQVLIGPACPGPARAEQPCPDKPYMETITILDAANQPVTQVQADAEGRFRVILPPGTYTLRPETTGAYPRASEQEVTVTPGEFTQVKIVYDSGIR